MIKSFNHKGLAPFLSHAATVGIQARHAERLRVILARLHGSTGPQDMNLPGLQLNELKGVRQGTWAVNASGNWRVTFVLCGKDAELVDCEDFRMNPHLTFAPRGAALPRCVMEEPYS